MHVRLPGDLCRPAHSAVSASRAWSPGGRPIPRRLGRLVDFGFASCPLFRNHDRIGSELRAARVDLGVLGGSQPSRCCGSQKWEPTCSDVPSPSATYPESSRRSRAPSSYPFTGLCSRNDTRKVQRNRGAKVICYDGGLLHGAWYRPCTARCPGHQPGRMRPTRP
jgi:hypothetical protein